METITVNTEKTVFGGDTIAKFDSKTIFIPFSMPYETLTVKILQHKKDYDNAEIVKIESKSPYRVEPKCKYYTSCGGCNMMHIQSNYQKQLKIQMLEDIFLQNKIDIKGTVLLIDGPDFNYRSRFQLNNGGLSEKKSNNIIPITQCECADEQINEYLKNTKFENRPQGRIQVFGSNNIQNTQKVFLSNPTVKKNEQVYTKSNKKNKPKQKNYFAGTILSEENKVTVQLLDKNISFDVRGFFQSNLHVYQKVINLIVDLLPGGQNILDMYAGCGSISAFLGKKYQNVTLVEHNRDALVFAEENMKETPHVSYGLSGENWVKTCASFCPKFDAVVIDPPRSGMEKEVRDYLCKSKIPFICSLSCDPTTQARDIKELLENGYEIQKTYLLDFYPNTSHIESLVYLKLKN